MKVFLFSVLFLFQLNQNDFEKIMTIYESSFTDYIENNKYAISDSDREAAKDLKKMNMASANLWFKLFISDLKKSSEINELVNTELIYHINNHIRNKYFEKLDEDFFIKVDQALHNSGISTE